MPKLILFTVMFILSLSAFAQNNEEARVKAAVEDRYRESIAAANKKHTAAMTNLYDDNAVLMPQSEEAVLGKAAIGEYYKKLFANPDFVPFTLKSDWNSFQLAGDIAIAASVFEGDATRKEKQIHFHGKDLLVWKKQSDGSWRIFRNMYDEIPAKK